MAYFIEDTSFEAVEIIGLGLAKKQLKIEPEQVEEDDLILSYIGAAISYAQSYTGAVIEQQKFIVKAKNFEDVLCFRKQKIIEIDKIEYLDLQGTLQVLSEDNYSLTAVDKYENKLTFSGDLPKIKAFTPDAVVAHLVCGFDKIPKAIKQALLLLITDFYEYRSDRLKSYNTTAIQLLSAYKIHY